MVTASKAMMESKIVQENASSMDNNVDVVFRMVEEAFGMTDKASVMVGEASVMVDKTWEKTSMVHKA